MRNKNFFLILYYLTFKGMDKSLDEFNLSTKENYTDFINRLYARLNVHNVCFLNLFFKFKISLMFFFFLGRTTLQ